MGRRRQGWKLRAPKAGRAIWTVRWWDGARQVERSTGETDRAAAGATAARLYAATVQLPAQSKRRSGPGGSTSEAAARWLASLQGSHAPGTLATWEVYSRAFCEWFPALPDLTAVRAAEFVSERLRQVRAATVRKESTALRSFVAWLHRNSRIGWDVPVPSVPRGALGTAHGQRRRTTAPTLSPAEVRRIVAVLPEWSRTRHGRQWPIRARFVVAYETGLRPSTLDRLSVPEHYRRGSRFLTLTKDVDKNRWDRDVPLTMKARRALDAVLPEAGLIFGKLDLRYHLERAAEAVLDRERAAVFCGAHFRSARATHLYEKAANRVGVQYLLGHLQASTGDRYVKPSLRAAEAALRQTGTRRRR